MNDLGRVEVSEIKAPVPVVDLVRDVGTVTIPLTTYERLKANIEDGKNQAYSLRKDLEAELEKYKKLESKWYKLKEENKLYYRMFMEPLLSEMGKSKSEFSTDWLNGAYEMKFEAFKTYNQDYSICTWTLSTCLDEKEDD